MDIADYANEGPPSVKLGALASYLKEQSVSAPIDMYRRAIGEILAYGTSERLEASHFLGRLLVLGIVSAAEGYARAILAASLEICPLARATAAKKAAPIGGLLWHGKTGFSRSVFENSSLASREELVKAFKDVGLTLDDANFKSILEDFDSVCHLRHGIVHGDGFLPGRNAVHLDIPRYENPVRIVVGYAQLQEVASVVTTLVVSINRQLFADMCTRWAVNWRKRSDWAPDQEDRLFRKVWATFHSADEREKRAGKSKITCVKCIADVRSQYNL